jgi:diguanylate cyclase (GGDEF)-like protein
MKDINDKLGHNEGDRALIDTAGILKKSLRKSDIIARIGGDEFAVLLTDIEEPEIEKIIIRHIHENLAKLNKAESRTYDLILSAGMSRYDPEHPCSIQELLQGADKSMYEDKRLHKLEKEVPPLLKGEKGERRVYERFKSGDNCWAELDISGKVRIVDISMGGVRLKAPRPLTADSTYKIKLSPSETEEIALTGIVVWSSISKSKNEGDGKFPYEAGLKFTELSKGLRSSLDKFTENIII